MTCAACSHENPPDATFCGECGAPLHSELCCERCGPTNPAGTKFCHGCGQRGGESSGGGPGLALARSAAPSPLPAAVAAGQRRALHRQPVHGTDNVLRIGDQLCRGLEHAHAWQAPTRSIPLRGRWAANAKMQEDTPWRDH